MTKITVCNGLTATSVVTVEERPRGGSRVARMSGREIAVLALLAAIWGSSFLFIKVSLDDLSPPMVAACRTVLAALLLAALTLRTSQGGRSRSWTPGQWQKFLVLAVFNAIIPYILIAWGEQHITSGLAAILNATTALFSFLLGYVVPSRFIHERLGFPGVAGLAVGIAGVALLVGGGGRGELAGELAIIAASASYAVAGNFARHAFEGQPVLVPALGQNVMAAILLMPVSLIFFRPSGWPALAPLLCVLALGLAGTGLAYVLYYWLIAHSGATRTLTVTYLLPVTAVAYGAIFLAEPIVWRQIAGMALILAGISGTSGLWKLSISRHRVKEGTALCDLGQ